MIDAMAHLNVLTKAVNDYYLLPQVKGTLTIDGILDRLREKRFATENVSGAHFIKAFLHECALASVEGYNIVTPFFRSSLSIRGTVYPQDIPSRLHPGRVKVCVKLEPGSEARSMTENVTVRIAGQAALTGPEIRMVYSRKEHGSNRLQQGALVMMEGRLLAVKGTAPGIGVIFEKADGSIPPVFITPAELIENRPARLMFLLPPAITAGEWRVKICTQSSSGNSLLKEPRTSKYPCPVTVYEPAADI